MSFFIPTVKFLKVISRKDREKAWDMSYFLINPSTWEILQMEKDKEEESFNGATDRSMMVNGRPI